MLDPDESLVLVQYRLLVPLPPLSHLPLAVSRNLIFSDSDEAAALPPFISPHLSC